MTTDRSLSEISPKPIRVIVVDAHPVFRHGLAAFIDASDDLLLVGQAATGKDAIELCAHFEADILIIDILPPELYNLTAMQTIHHQYPNTRIIALTSITNERVIKAAFLAGAMSYLLKTMAFDELAHAIRRAHSGEAALAPEVSQLLIKAFIQPPRLEQPLTKRERQVLALIVAGHNNTKIAAQLGVGRETVKSHVSHILAKLGVKSRIDAVILTLQQLPPEGHNPPSGG